jgi:vitamin B12 transporter
LEPPWSRRAFRRDSDIEIDRSETDNSGETRKEETGARVFAELVTGPVTHRLSYSEFVIERRDPGGGTTAFDGTRREVISEGNTTLGTTADLDFGVSRTQEEAETSSFPEKDETVVSAFAELRWRPSDRTTVSLALRRDDNSDFGVETIGRLGLVHRRDGGVTLRAVAGTGYRAPSLFERYSGFGDPALQPETSESYEPGWIRHSASGRSSRRRSRRPSRRPRPRRSASSRSTSAPISWR